MFKTKQKKQMQILISDFLESSNLVELCLGLSQTSALRSLIARGSKKDWVGNADEIRKLWGNNNLNSVGSSKVLLRFILFW